MAAAAEVFDRTAAQPPGSFSGELVPIRRGRGACGHAGARLRGHRRPVQILCDARGVWHPGAGAGRFPDHHRYTAAEAGALLARAERERLMLVTTEKDLARMHGDPAAAQLAARTAVLPVAMEFASGETLTGSISKRSAGAATR